MALIQPTETTNLSPNASAVCEALATPPKWPLRRTALFVVSTSAVLWLAIAISFWHLI